MSPRALLRTSALLLLIAAAAAAGYLMWRSFAVTITVATPPLLPDVQKAWLELGREVTQEGGWVKLRRLPVADMAEAAQALSDGKADAAVLRTDIALPAKAKTIAILRRDRIFLIVPAHSPIDSFQDLKGRAVGILPGQPGNDALLSAILNFFSVAPETVERIPVTPQEAGAAVRQKRIAAVFVVGRAGRGQASEAFSSINRATKGVPDIVGVDDSDAVANRLVTLESSEIAAGAFGGVAPRPEEEVSTIAATWRLVVGPSLSNMTVGALTRQLFDAKGRLLASHPGLADLEEPDTEESTFPVHPAAKAYFDGDEPNLFDRAESLFWIGSALIGVVGSALTWLVAKLRFREEEQNDLRRLVALLADVREADAARLAELRTELDAVVARLLEEGEAGSVEDTALGTYQIAIAYARQAIDDRAAILAGHAPA
jgi:TRAP transporter TAXI family solute receptor